jgi:hypothetical protein
MDLPSSRHDSWCAKVCKLLHSIIMKLRNAHLPEKWLPSLSLSLRKIDNKGTTRTAHAGFQIIHNVQQLTAVPCSARR